MAEYRHCPIAIPAASFMVMCCTAARACGPEMRMSPMWLTSKTPTLLRTARCSFITPPAEGYSTGGVMKEHLAVRNSVGVFDVSHMGDIRISGPQALAAVQHITMNDAAGMAIGQCRYSAMLYPEGTFV